MNDENIKKYGVPDNGATLHKWYDETHPYEERVRITRNAYKIYRRMPRSQRYLREGDYVRFVLSVPRSVKVEAFAEIADHLPDKTYWTLLGHLFWQANNHAVYNDLWVSLMQSPRPDHKHFMTPDQQEAWDALPERVIIFRGHGANNKYGTWYTLKLIVAMGVASLHGKAGTVSTYIVSKHDLFYGGGEQDAVFFVKGLADIHRNERPPNQPEVPRRKDLDLVYALHHDDGASY